MTDTDNTEAEVQQQETEEKQPTEETEKREQETAAPAETKSEPEQKEEPQGAPETYSDFTFNESLKIDEQGLEEFKLLAKELNLTQGNAQKLVDYQTQLVTRQQEALDASVKEQTAEWKMQSEKQFTPEEISDAVRGFSSAPQAVRDMISSCGFENHPEFVKFFRDIGQTLKEDRFETGKPSGKTSKSAASVLYPGMN